MNVAKKLLLLLATLPLFSAPLFSQGNQELIIMVTNVQSAKGTIMLAIYDSPNTFLGEQVFRGLTIPVNGKGNAKVVVNDLPRGTYAISIYHDENDNESLDSNIFRIPKEPYGFSNNVRSSFGPPKFEAAKFELQAYPAQIEIALR